MRIILSCLSTILIPFLVNGQSEQINPDSVYGLARKFYNKGNYESAVPYFEDAAELYFEKKYNFQNWVKAKAIISWYNSTQVNLEPEKQIVWMDECFSQFWGSIRDSKSTQSLASLYADFCRAYELSGRYQDAFDKALEAENLFAQTNYPSKRLTATLNERIRHIKGLSANRMGDFTTAKITADSLEKYYLQRKEYEEAANIRLLGGVSAIELKNYAEAISISQEAISWPSIASTTKGKLKNNIGYAYFRLGEFKKAILYGNEAITIYSEWISNHPSSKEIWESKRESHLLLGLSYQYTKEYNRAKIQFQEAKKSIEFRYGHLNRIETLRTSVYEGNLYLNELADLEEALKRYQQGLAYGIPGFRDGNLRSNPTSQQIDGIKEPFIVHALAGKASAWLALYEQKEDTSLLDLAISTFSLAFTLEQQLKQKYRYTDSKLLAGEIYRPYYESALKAVEIRYQQTRRQLYLEFALKFMENSKAFVLWEALNNASFSGNASPEQLEESKNLTFAKMEEVQQFIPNNKTLLVEYFEGKHNIYVLCVTKESGNLISINKPKFFAVNLNDFLELISDGEEKVRNEGVRNYYSEFQYQSKYWYNLLLTPVFEGPRSIKNDFENLVIIPDQHLANLPFEVLTENSSTEDSSGSIWAQFRKLPYLIQRYRIHSGYSLNTLLRSSQTQYVSNTDYVGFAPDYKDDDTRITSKGEYNLSPVMDTQKTIQSISKFFKRSYSYLLEEANITNFKKHLSNANILHLLMHAESNDTLDLNSFLAFSKDSSLNQGLLFSSDIYLQEIKTNLLVLSACETGKGKIFEGEGKMSITRAFIQSGCPRIINSLWNADEKSTNIILQSFFQSVRDGNSIDVALRDAKLKALKEGRPLPYFWGNYVLIGSSEVLFQDASPNSKFLYFFWGLLAIGLMLFWLKFRGYY